MPKGTFKISRPKETTMKDYLNFSGKHVIVTGGRRGIGRAVSIAFAERGAKVMISSICSHREGGGNFSYGVMKAVTDLHDKMHGKFSSQI